MMISSVNMMIWRMLNVIFFLFRTRSNQMIYQQAATLHQASLQRSEVRYKIYHHILNYQSKELLLEIAFKLLLIGVASFVLMRNVRTFKFPTSYSIKGINDYYCYQTEWILYEFNTFDEDKTVVSKNKSAGSTFCDSDSTNCYSDNWATFSVSKTNKAFKYYRMTEKSSSCSGFNVVLLGGFELFGLYSIDGKTLSKRNQRKGNTCFCRRPYIPYYKKWLQSAQAENHVCFVKIIYEYLRQAFDRYDRLSEHHGMIGDCVWYVLILELPLKCWSLSLFVYLSFETSSNDGDPRIIEWGLRWICLIRLSCTDMVRVLRIEVNQNHQ